MDIKKEAVGDFAQPIYDLLDDLGDTDRDHANVLHDLIRYLDGDTIKDFVDEFRRVHDYGNDKMEHESVKDNSMLGSVVKELTEQEFDEAAGEKDACYRKVKSRYKVWPSAYASGALTKCRKVGAANWGNSKKK